MHSYMEKVIPVGNGLWLVSSDGYNSLSHSRSMLESMIRGKATFGHLKELFDLKNVPVPAEIVALGTQVNVNGKINYLCYEPSDGEIHSIYESARKIFYQHQFVLLRELHPGSIEEVK